MVIGETVKETRPVFEEAARAKQAPIIFAEENPKVESVCHKDDGMDITTNIGIAPLHYELGGDYQAKNANTILWAVSELRKSGLKIEDKDIVTGFGKVKELTGLRGRWEIISRNPMVIMDTGHNPGGLAYNMNQLSGMKARRKRIVIGMVSDKDVSGSLSLMPKDAVYYFTKASVKRALDENQLCEKAKALGLHGTSYPTVAEAYNAALSETSPEDIIYIGGSNFVIADFLNG